MSNNEFVPCPDISLITTLPVLLSKGDSLDTHNTCPSCLSVVFPHVTWPLVGSCHHSSSQDASAEVEVSALHRVTAAIHGRSLEIRVTKPLITLWAYNPPAAPSEWNTISLLQPKPSGEQRRAGTQGTGRKWSYPHHHTVIVISTA